MKSKLVLNYQDMNNVYLYMTDDKHNLYINASSQDGNIIYIDENNTEHSYDLENMFLK